MNLLKTLTFNLKLLFLDKDKREEWRHLLDAVKAKVKENNPKAKKKNIDKYVFSTVFEALKNEVHLQNLKNEIRKWEETHPERVPFDKKVDPSLAGVRKKEQLHERPDEKDFHDILDDFEVDAPTFNFKFEEFKKAPKEHQELWYKDMIERYNKNTYSEKDKAELEHALKLISEHQKNLQLFSSKNRLDKQIKKMKTRNRNNDLEL